MTEEKHRYILQSASDALTDMVDEVLELLEVGKPNDLEYAMFLAKTVSKLSPLVGNMLEYYMVGYLNEHSEDLDGTWVRQDPGFPDTCYKGDVTPEPGIEVKAWFPLSTEITARFKDSVTHFEDENINIALIAWVPEYIIYGRPVVLDVCVESAKAVAVSRDLHFHDPPAYVVLEPEDTSDRTSNLQQSNTNGYKIQAEETSESF